MTAYLPGGLTSTGTDASTATGTRSMMVSAGEGAAGVMTGCGLDAIT